MNGLKQFIFSNNVLNVGNGAITTDTFPNYAITAESVEIEGNTITAKNIPSDTYNAPGVSPSARWRWLFPIYIDKYYNDVEHTSLKIKNNIFNIVGHAIHFFMAKYNSKLNDSRYGTLLPPAEAEINDISGNTCSASSSILIKRFDIQGNGYSERKADGRRKNGDTAPPYGLSRPEGAVFCRGLRRYGAKVHRGRDHADPHNSW